MDNLQLLENTIPFWNKLNKTEQSTIVNNHKIITYKKGDNIHDASQECLGMLYIIKGTMRTYLLSDEGKEITLYRLGDGEMCILAASCVLHNITFDVFIDAEEDCEILQISAPCLATLIKSNIYVECFAYKTATDRFSDVMWAMQQILFMSFDRRLATFLLDECSKKESDTIKLTHEQIAKYMGSAREVVTRMLKYFADEGYVTLSRGNVTISNKNALRKII